MIFFNATIVALGCGAVNGEIQKYTCGLRSDLRASNLKKLPGGHTPRPPDPPKLSMLMQAFIVWPNHFILASSRSAPPKVLILKPAFPVVTNLKETITEASVTP